MNRIILSACCFALLALTSCQSALMLYKKGEKRFRLGEYQPAIENYEKAKAKNFNAAPVNYALAESYRLSNRIKEAEPFYKAALDARTNQEEARFHYALALKAAGKYPEAAEQFAQYVKTGTNLQNKSLARKEIENLPEIERIQKEKTFYEVENVSLLNTEASEFSPQLQSDTLVFTASRKDEMYKANGDGMLGMYTFVLDSARTDTASAKAEEFSQSLTVSNVNEGTPTFSEDGKVMIFARGNDGRKKGTRDVDLYVSRFREGKWTEPEMLAISKPETWDACPALSTDGKTLYFASNREGGLGGIDLYSATADGTGKFGRVSNLGPQINTAGDDMFPYVSDDGKLYFSSEGHPGLGGLDLFVATRVEGEVTIQNMGVPMNSTGDDFGITFKTPTAGYMSSNREGGKGGDDIYSFVNTAPDYKIVNYFLAGKTVTKPDSADGQIVLGNTKIRFLEGSKPIGEVTTGEDGSFKFRVEESKNYTIIAEKPEYFTRREGFSMSGRSIPQEQLVKPVTDTTFNVVVPMERAAVNVVFTVDNIYYDLDKANIRSDAAEELDKLVDFLNDNPNIKIELSSHTDTRASDEYNQDLSQRRAESAVQYIISNGIGANRITAKGYGETKLVVPSAQTEEEHQRNRRTEIKILEVNK